MKGRQVKGAPSRDLLVCFPAPSRLTLMPKPVCSPARAAQSNKRHSHHNQHHHSKKLTGKRAGHASPLLGSKTKPTGPEITEPTSPEVTCAGQIKVLTKASSCKSWQSVMDEIERIHSSENKHKKRPSWAESMGFKKEIMQFLTCLRNIRFNCRCFGAFPEADITTDDEDDDDEDEKVQENLVGVEGNDNNEASRTFFSKWFMVLQENQNNCYYKEYQRNSKEKQKFCVADKSVAAPATPPPNALLLMRCRSAPAKSRFEEKPEEEENTNEDKEEEGRKKEVKKTNNLKSLLKEEKRNNKENLAVVAYDTDPYKVSYDIAKETRIVDDMKDLLSRSRSWKR